MKPATIKCQSDVVIVTISESKTDNLSHLSSVDSKTKNTKIKKKNKTENYRFFLSILIENANTSVKINIIEKILISLV